MSKWMSKFKIVHERSGCIGCAACSAIAPKLWKMNDDGLSDCIGSKKLKDETTEKDFDDDEFKDHKEAAEACPVNVIHIRKKDTDEKII